MAGRDLVALQRLAGNRAVTGLVRRNVQRQQTGTLPKAQGDPSLGASSTPGSTGTGAAPKAATPFELQYQGLTLEKAARNLLADITMTDPFIVVVLQRNLLAVYGNSGERLVQVELKMPEGVNPLPGVYITPPASEAAKAKAPFALRRLMVDPDTKNWVLGGYTAFLKQETKKPAGKAPPAAPGARPPGRPPPVRRPLVPLARRTGGDAATPKPDAKATTGDAAGTVAPARAVTRPRRPSPRP